MTRQDKLFVTKWLFLSVEEPGLYSEGNEESPDGIEGFDLLCYVLQTFSQYMIVELCHRRGFILGIKLLQKGQYLCGH